MSNAFTVIMYHYVREEYNGSGIFGMTPASFEEQIIYLKENYEILHPNIFFEYLYKKSSFPDNPCVLTFDDGLIDHYKYVLPILLKYDLYGIFSIITDVLGGNRIIMPHKVHLLCQAIGERAFEKEFLYVLGSMDKNQGYQREQYYQEVERRYRWDNKDFSGVKYLINYVLPYPLVDAVIEQVFINKLGSEDNYSSKMYMSIDQIKKLQNLGMIISGHSHEHRIYSRLDNSAQMADIFKCISILREILSVDVRSFTYPYGKYSTFNEFTKKCLKENGLCCAFANELGRNDSNTDLFALKRLDPKDVKHFFSLKNVHNN